MKPVNMAGLWVPLTTLPQHPLTRYLKVRLEVTDGVLRWRLPRTLLGVVPIGESRIMVPLRQIRSLAVRMAVRLSDLLVGIAVMAVSLAAPLALGLGWVTAPLVAAGAWVALASFGPQVVLVTRAGAVHRARVCFGHRIDAQMYVSAVNDLMPQLAEPAL